MGALRDRCVDARCLHRAAWSRGSGGVKTGGENVCREADVGIGYDLQRVAAANAARTPSRAAVEGRLCAESAPDVGRSPAFTAPAGWAAPEVVPARAPVPVAVSVVRSLAL